MFFASPAETQTVVQSFMRLMINAFAAVTRYEQSSDGKQTIAKGGILTSHQCFWKICILPVMHKIWPGDDGFMCIKLCVTFIKKKTWLLLFDINASTPERDIMLLVKRNIVLVLWDQMQNNRAQYSAPQRSTGWVQRKNLCGIWNTVHTHQTCERRNAVGTHTHAAAALQQEECNTSGGSWVCCGVCFHRMNRCPVTPSSPHWHHWRCQSISAHTRFLLLWNRSVCCMHAMNLHFPACNVIVSACGILWSFPRVDAFRNHWLRFVYNTTAQPKYLNLYNTFYGRQFCEPNRV